MSDDILNTIEVLANRVSAKEEEANKLKKLVNELCSEAEIDPRYPHISEAGGGGAAVRSDQFYGQTLTAAIRNYLECRKSSGLGAAPVADIFRAIRGGGYKFETNSEENAKISVGNALRKTSSIFHRLPNGHYGLLVWYPSAKAQPEADLSAGSKRKRGRPSKKQATASGAPNTNGIVVTNREIRDVILQQKAEFQASDIEAAVKAKFPAKELPKSKIASVLFILKKGKGLLKEGSARTGSKGAVYAGIAAQHVPAAIS